MVNSPSSSSDEEEEEEQFYESLDRILSSSSPSTSASDDDGDRRSCRRSHPRFPPISAASFDVWISEPSSVEERRRRLLQQMGLSGDPSLCRVPEQSSDSRSKAALPTPRSFHRHRPSLGVPSTRKPPLFVRPLSSPAIDFYGGGGEDAGECKIKNLDTGREFVVKEVREDGMWGKLREVGTGRHLSMEEFEISVGVSPIVQELMRRQSEETEQPSGSTTASDGPNGAGTRSKRRGGLLKSIKNVVGGGQRRSSDEKEKDSSSSERGGGRRSSSTTDDGQNGHHGPARAKVRNYGKLQKELTGLFMSQEIKAHDGSIWSIKFSLDGRYLASAGEDCVIHVWKVSENERKGGLVSSERGEIGSPDPLLALACVEGSHWEKMKKRRAKVPGSRRSSSSVDQLMVPEYVFALSDKPVCSFRGHLDDVLDLSWSKSEYLLSSSMDKTVKLWHLSSNSCLQTFTHSDYVTCIQFNPVDDRYFISGSLDEKVRIWSIPDRQIVDWNDLHEMITAACYTPDGQSALVGSHKGCCHLYNTSENKLHRKSQIDLKNKKKKSNLKKITGFKFAPGSSSQVLITSADSRIRFVDGVELVHKFKGFRNTSSQISASFTANRKYIVCASEDSHVYVWRCDAIDSRPNRTKGCITETNSYEQFHCSDVTVATPWPPASMDSETQTTSSGLQNGMGELLKSNSYVPNGCSYPSNGSSAAQNGQFGDRTAATWPEEKLYAEVTKYNSQIKVSSGDDVTQSRPAWGMVIVTAGRGGQIRTYQNFGFRI